MKYFCSIKKQINVTDYMWSQIPKSSEVELTARAVSRAIAPKLQKTGYSRMQASDNVLVITQLEYKEVEADTASEALEIAFPQLKGVTRAPDSTDDSACIETKMDSICSFTVDIKLSNFELFISEFLDL